MTFTTPCFVRVEDAAERKKLIEWCNDVIGRSGEKDCTYGDVVLCIYLTVKNFYNYNIIGNIHDNPELLKTE